MPRDGLICTARVRRCPSRGRHERDRRHAGATGRASPHQEMWMNTASETELTTSIRVNGSRLWDSLMEMAKIGATPKGGVCRLALTDLDKQGRDLFVRWAKQAGC